MKLGVDNFSLRFNNWNAFELLDYARQIGLDVLHFSNLAPFERLDTTYLDEVKKHADHLDLAIEIGMGSVCPSSNTFSDVRGSASEQLIEMLHMAVRFGSPAVRCYLGNNADRRTGIQRHIDNTVATCKSVRTLALELGVKIAIENHAGDLQARELRELIERAGPDYVGACIDAGNPLWVAESPFTTLEQLAPFVLMSHIRDTAVWGHPLGAAAQWVPMGEGTVGIAAWSRQYIELCPQTNFTLEIIGTMPPRILNYLETDFWEIYPDMPAHEFARFLNHVADGHAPTQPALTVDGNTITPEIRAALATEQRRQLERSVAYCRQTLNIT